MCNNNFQIEYFNAIKIKDIDKIIEIVRNHVELISISLIKFCEYNPKLLNIIRNNDDISYHIRHFIEDDLYPEDIINLNHGYELRQCDINNIKNTLCYETNTLNNKIINNINMKEFISREHDWIVKNYHNINGEFFEKYYQVDIETLSSKQILQSKALILIAIEKNMFNKLITKEINRKLFHTILNNATNEQLLYLINNESEESVYFQSYIINNIFSLVENIWNPLFQKINNSVWLYEKYLEITFSKDISDSWFIRSSLEQAFLYIVDNSSEVKIKPMLYYLENMFIFIKNYINYINSQQNNYSIDKQYVNVFMRLYQYYPQTRESIYSISNLAFLREIYDSFFLNNII